MIDADLKHWTAGSMGPCIVPGCRRNLGSYITVELGSIDNVRRGPNCGHGVRAL